MTLSSRELWDLYDSSGTPLGRTGFRGDPLKEDEFHLVVQVWVRNSFGEYLIQKRSASLASLPGIWATTAGSVLAGESACVGAVRELAEELGIRASEDELNMVLQERVSHSLGTAWLLERDVADAEIRLQEEEVSEVMWASPATIRQMVREGSFYDYGDHYFGLIFAHRWGGEGSALFPVGETLPLPARVLHFGDVSLRFARLVPGDPARGFVPFYHFRVVANGGTDVGHINFRVGNTDHVRFCAGHIGFEILEPFRGRRYAFQAVCALAPFVRSLREEVIMTCDPDNHPSRRTIERLGASFIDEVPVPNDDPHYQRGSRSKRRYRWLP